MRASHLNWALRGTFRIVDGKIMQNKSGTIKNPLSVIAIFAGIAEISGTLVLPHIAPENQYLFIWFLMIFPFALVVMFFLTLNWNYKVLYAPSDFKDEEHFINLQKASTSEVLDKIKEELAEEDEQESSLSDNAVKDIEVDLEEAQKFVETAELRFSTGRISTKEEREKQKDIVRSINKIRMIETRLLEDILFEKLQKELDGSIQRDMKLENSNFKFMFDGLVHRGDNLTAIEFKRMNRNTMNSSMSSALPRKYNEVFQSLTEKEKKNFSLILAVATEDDPNYMKEYFSRILAPLNFEFKVLVYSVDDLSKEQVEVSKAS